MTSAVLTLMAIAAYVKVVLAIARCMSINHLEDEQ